MKQIFSCLLLAVGLLAGCASPGVETKAPLRTAPAPKDLPTAVSTLVPRVTAPPAATPGYPSPSENAYPSPQTAETAYPAPQALAVASPAVQAEVVPFHDCIRTPGLAGCSADAASLKARLAYIDTAPSRLVNLDLEDGQGWQLPIPEGAATVRLEWSAPGQAGQRLLLALGDERYQVFTESGKTLEHGTGQTPLAWQPDAALGKNGEVRAENGDRAALEQTPDLRWQLHVTTSQAEKSLPLEANAGDMLYRLLGWVPGQQALLGQAYFAGNQAMTQGGQLIIIDANNGAIQTFPASMPLSDFPAAYFAWDPTRPARLAFLESGETGVIAPRLALLDIQTGQVETPLPEGLLLAGLAWNPDGRLAFAAARVDGLTTSEARKDFPAPGIYLLDPQGGQTEPLVSSPPGAADTWPQWTADGQTLVYARAITGQNEQSMLQVRARRLKDGVEWVLVEGISISGAVARLDFASRWLAFANK